MPAGHFADKHSFLACMVSEAAESAVMAQRNSSDLAINGDGTLKLIKGLQGLTTLEYHSKKLDIYSYVGCGVRGPDAGSSIHVCPSTSKNGGYVRLWIAAVPSNAGLQHRNRLRERRLLSWVSGVPQLYR